MQQYNIICFDFRKINWSESEIELFVILTTGDEKIDNSNGWEENAEK